MGFFDKLKGRQVRDQIKNEAYFRKYIQQQEKRIDRCLLYTSPSPRD